MLEVLGTSVAPEGSSGFRFLLNLLIANDPHGSLCLCVQSAGPGLILCPARALRLEACLVSGGGGTGSCGTREGPSALGNPSHHQPLRPVCDLYSDSPGARRRCGAGAVTGHSWIRRLGDWPRPQAPTLARRHPVVPPAARR